MLTDWEVNWGLLLLWKKETAHRSLPILNNPLNTNPNLTIHWTPRIRLQYILTTSPTLNSSVHINRICFHIVHHYSLLCVSYPNNQSSIKKKHKNIFIFFSFQKTKRRRIKRTVQLSQRRRMKITALLVLKCNPDGSDPVVLATAMDVSHFGYFQRSSVKEFILFVARTVGKRTPPGQRQSVQHEGSIFNFRLQSVSLFF